MKTKNEISKYICYLLRHNPSDKNLQIDKNGFVDINKLIQSINISKEYLLNIVNTDSKNRYEIIDNNIRCRQGHSILSLDFEEKIPPDILYHGTNKNNYEKIMKDKKIKKMNRHHVHLSDSLKTAETVAFRHKKDPVILEILTKNINNKFYISSNGVWLTDDFDTSAIRKTTIYIK